MDMDLTDVNFEVSDDSSEEEDEVMITQRHHIPRSSPHDICRLEEPAETELGLDQLLGYPTTSSSSSSSSLSSSATTALRLSTGPARRVHHLMSDESVEDCSIALSPCADEGTNVPARNIIGEQESMVYATDEVDPLDSSTFSFAANTTLSLDDEPGVESTEESGGIFTPRLVFSKRQRDLFDSCDVKEIVLHGSVGETTTTVLEFSNQRDAVQKLAAKAVQMRFDTFGAVSTKTNQEHFTPGGNNASVSSFDVYPNTLRILPGEMASIHIRFSPHMEGVYGGVMKIRSDKRTFTLLLRGESSPSFCDVMSSNNQSIPQACTSKTVKSAGDQGRKESDLSPPTDPILLRQQWLMEWLSRSAKTNTDLPPPALMAAMKDSSLYPMAPAGPKSLTADSNDALTTANTPSEAQDLMIVPTSLRLLPQRKEVQGPFGLDLKFTGLMHGELMLRNFTALSREIVIIPSSAAIQVSNNRVTLSSHDVMKVAVEFDPDHPTALSPTAISEPAIVGAVLIRSDRGEELSAEIQMPPRSFLTSSADINVDLRKHLKSVDCLVNFVNTVGTDANENMEASVLPQSLPQSLPPCASNSVDTVVVNTNSQSALERGRQLMERRVVTQVTSSPADAKLLERKRANAAKRREHGRCILKSKLIIIDVITTADNTSTIAISTCR